MTFRNYHKTAVGYEMQSEIPYRVNDKIDRFYIDIKWFDKANKKVYHLLHGRNLVATSFDRKSLKEIAERVAKDKECGFIQ